MLINMKISTPKILAIIATTLGIVVIGVGLVINGSPTKRRNIRLDNERIANLSTIANSIYNAQKEISDFKLPVTLQAAITAQEFWFSSREIVDPETSRPYEYEVISETKYRLCANFSLVSEEIKQNSARYDMGYLNYNEFWQHPAGRHCFEIEAQDPLGY